MLRVGRAWRFDRSSLPSSEGSDFPRSRRLLKPDEYRRVFNDGRRSIDALFLVLAHPNDMPFARLGLAVSKKYSRLAVKRNRIKRLVRESFRHHQEQLVGLDLVVVTRQGIGRADNGRCFDSLHRHWQRIVEICAG